jgi:hypothetical protein|tara:strand:- start:45 stop:764 length:720 start_codon:yes stop_codon:yes gene_type:complete
MIKKFPARLVGPIWHPKSSILKSQSSPKHSLISSEIKADQVAQKRFNQIFDPDNNTWESIKAKSIKLEAAKDIASRTGTKQWGTLIKKNLKREDIFNKTISTSTDKPSFIKKWQKALDKADIGAEAARVRTSLLFTGRKGLDPLKHQTKDIKFIRSSKRFRKGGTTEYAKSMLPERTYSQIEKGAYGQKKRMAEFASQSKNLTKQGKVNWNKFWKTEGPRQASYIKYKRTIYKKHFKKK